MIVNSKEEEIEVVLQPNCEEITDNSRVLNGRKVSLLHNGHKRFVCGACIGVTSYIAILAMAELSCRLAGQSTACENVVLVAGSIVLCPFITLFAGMVFYCCSLELWNSSCLKD
ncbi:MAG: hypothetical protein VX777_03890 [Chlamydiota bacterium]|nr:hypothetical protein [Chlamydiota bacterium]